jgi:hypothetical protein
LISSARAILESRLFPVALEVVSAQVAKHLGISIDEKSSVLLVRFVGNKKGVEYQSHQASEELHWSKIEIIERDESLWQKLSAMPLHESSRVNWRASVLPGKTRDLLEQVQTIYGDSIHSTLWQIGVADGRMRMMNHDEHQFNQSREATRLLGGTFVSETNGNLDAGSSSGIMHRIKQQLDPENLFPMR